MSLLAEIQSATTETTTAPLDILARAVVGYGDDAHTYVVGTRSGLANAGLYVERVKDGATKYRPASKLTDIARAMSADFTDTDGKSVEVF